MMLDNLVKTCVMEEVSPKARNKGADCLPTTVYIVSPLAMNRRRTL